jgi:hypothetical protein
MITNQPKNSLLNTLWLSLTRLWPFFQRLQWRLTFTYALFTAVTALVFGLIGVALLWYLTFSLWIPDDVARSLLRTGDSLSPYLEHTPPDLVGLNNWLRRMTRGDDMPPTIPTEKNNGNGSPPAPPPPSPIRFGEVVSMAVVNTAGEVIISYPAENFTVGQVLPAPPEAKSGFEAALQGQTNPVKLTARNATGNIVATAPIFGANKQLVGAIFIETVPPLQERGFLQFAVQQTILPVVAGVLVVGVVAGILFGYFIAS